MASQPSYTGGTPAIPGKPVVHTYPTPNLLDRIYVERKDTRTGKFELPDQGDPYDGVNADKYEGFIFATAKPTDQIGWIDFFWINERANQDEYNYIVDFPYVNRDYPRYTRTYVVLRTDDRTTEPQADTVDPVHSDLLLTDHKWLRLDDPILDSIFIGIQRVYERLPSPIITHYELDDKQVLTTVTAQEAVVDPTIVTDAFTASQKTERTGTAKQKYTVGVSAEVFPDTNYIVSREDAVIPYKFRTYIPSTMVSQEVAGIAVLPVLGPQDWIKQEHQITKYKKFVANTTRVHATVSLINYKMTRDKQIETLVETWGPDSMTISPNCLTIEADVEAIGNGEAIKSVGTVPNLFTARSLSKKIPLTVPDKFVRANPTLGEELLSCGVINDPIVFTGTNFEKTEEQVDDKTKKTTTRSRGAIFPVSLISYKQTKDKQLETITETWGTASQTIAPNYLTIEASVENIGNSEAIKTVGTVPELFTDTTSKKTLALPVPEKFIRANPTTDVDYLVDGTIVDPPVLTGDNIEKSEHQVDAKTKRVSIKSRGDIFPVTLVSFKMTKDKQLETLTETWGTDAQTISPNVLTIEANVENIGDGEAIKSVGTVGTLFTNKTSKKEIPLPVPEKFIRSNPTATTDLLVAGPIVDPPVLGANDLEKSEEQVDDKTKRVHTKSRGANFPVSLVSFKMTKDKQLETLTETWGADSQTISPNVLTIEASVENIGDGEAIKSLGTVGTLFTNKTSKKTIPLPVPEKFIRANPTTETDLLVAGPIVDPPVLASGDIEKSEQQVDDKTKRVNTKSRGINFPVSLVSFKMTKDKQLETLTETWGADSQTINPNVLTIEASVENIGDGEAIKSLGTVGTLFTNKTSKLTKPFNVPEKFVRDNPTADVDYLVSGNIVDPPILAADDFEKSEQQVDDKTKRVAIKSRGDTFPVSLTSLKMTKDKQLETLIETWGADSQTISPNFLTVEASVEAIGNGEAIKSVGSVGNLFDNKTSKKGFPLGVPEKFLRDNPSTEVDYLLQGQIVDPPVLAGPNYERTEQQVDDKTKRINIKSRGTSFPASLTSLKMTKDKQKETIIETWGSDTQTFTPSYLTIEASVEAIGAGQAIKMLGTVDDLFTGLSSSKIKADLVPENFRAAVPTFVTEYLIQGQVVDPPNMVTGDLEKTEEQVDDKTKRVRLKTRAGASVPITQIDKEITTQYGGGVANIERTYDTQGSDVLSPGLVVLAGKITKLGNGFEVMEEKKLPSGGWPVLLGTEVDPRTGITVAVVKQVVAAGTTGGISGGTYTDIKPLDKWRSISIASSLDPSSLPVDTTWETSIEHTFPNTLHAISYLWAWASNADHYDFASALVTDMEQGYSGPCRAVVTESFTNGPPATTVLPTILRPQGHSIGFAWGYASAAEVVARATTWSISASLHDALVIGGGVVLVGGGFSGTLPATDPIALPSGTLIVKDWTVERWRFGIFNTRKTEIYVP